MLKLKGILLTLFLCRWENWSPERGRNFFRATRFNGKDIISQNLLFTFMQFDQLPQSLRGKLVRKKQNPKSWEDKGKIFFSFSKSSLVTINQISTSWDLLTLNYKISSILYDIISYINIKAFFPYTDKSKMADIPIWHSWIHCFNKKVKLFTHGMEISPVIHTEKY